ncbi:hypothetical protein QBZ16_000241 [Prototheca wickerhamii]|uniref:Holocytochrome c-type synthase n=1 Tax=Prototheca wickerhamii TaxID=3111 RepID=A0AAD9MMY1_PROWI|nr:hypothetical protein QBZ16_000241 [Prototheca wickerhamii]
MITSDPLPPARRPGRLQQVRPAPAQWLAYLPPGARAPVIGATPANGMPSSSNAPQPGQSKPLSTWRQPSSIPTVAADGLPGHQTPTGEAEVSLYGVKSGDDMTAVVAIHNAVNERAWREIKTWEDAAGEPAPKLLRFRGRPTDLSPKARLLNFLGYRLPFDRHDWVVERRDGSEVRYVIDFYNGAPLPSMPVALHLDVRPALDSPSALWSRVRMQAGWVASGRWRDGTIG